MYCMSSALIRLLLLLPFVYIHCMHMYSNTSSETKVKKTGKTGKNGHIITSCVSDDDEEEDEKRFIREK